jgi:hypothetical protein
MSNDKAQMPNLKFGFCYLDFDTLNLRILSAEGGSNPAYEESFLDGLMIFR